MNGDLRTSAIIVIQSSTIFIALSILLGRMYSLQYYNALGIPTSEARLNAIEYSIISPDVTLFGIGISALFVIHIWTRKTRLIPPTNRWTDYAITLSLWVVGLLLLRAFFPALERDYSWRSDVPGLSGVWLLSPFILYAVGTETFANYISQIDTSKRLGRIERFASIFLGTVFRIFITIALVIYLFISGPLFGEIDARITLHSAPKAVVELKSSTGSSMSEINRRASNCSDDTDSCTVKILLTSQHFVYLQYVDWESSASQRSLHAISHDEISRIVYLADNN